MKRLIALDLHKKAREAAIDFILEAFEGEPSIQVIGFTGGGLDGPGYRAWAGRSAVTPLWGLRAGMPREAALTYLRGLPIAPPDLAIPMLYAADIRLPTDRFTLAIHRRPRYSKMAPLDALRVYNDRMARAATMDEVILR